MPQTSERPGAAPGPINQNHAGGEISVSPNLPDRADNRAAALDLAANGWAVFPCVPTGPRAKSPILTHGHLDASRDPDLVRRWWTRWPIAMIGAAVPASLIVLDIDPRNGGDLAGLEALAGPLPETLTVWSGRGDGGLHRYYMRPAGPLTSTRLPQGVDLKVNGYMIMPPSIHPATGQPYGWDDRPVAPLPLRLRELLRPLPPPVRTGRGGSEKVAGLLRTVSEAQEGNRNRVLFWASCRAAEGGHLDQLEDDLVTAALSAGLSELSARRTVESARRAAS